MKSALPIAALALAVSAPYAWAQDAAAGEQSFKKCFPCHSIGEGAKNKVGPELNGIDGRHSGTAPDYNYSDAMQKFPGKWDYESLNKFITKPTAYVPGTKMGFAGLKKPEDRADVIAWLRLQSDSPEPLPAGK